MMKQQGGTLHPMPLRRSGGGQHDDDRFGVASQVAAVIFAGTHQWRASRLERSIPRPLIPVANQELILYGLSWLRAGGIRDIRICANSDTTRFQRRLGNGSAFGLNIQYVEDDMPRGPAGCLRDAAATLSHDAIVAVDGTIIPQGIPLLDVLATHDAAAAALTIVAPRAGSPGAQATCGRPSGVYVFDHAAVVEVPEAGYQDIKESLIPRLHRGGRSITLHEIDAEIPRIAGADSCLAASGWVVERAIRHAHRIPGYNRHGEALIHETAFVSSSAHLIGPLLIGPNVRIEDGVTLIGPMTLGAGCSVGGGAVVSRSVLWTRSIIDADATVDRCLLTYGARIRRKATVQSMVVHPRRHTWRSFQFRRAERPMSNYA